MDFGRAIDALKEGLRVSRPGWNGKGMFLLLVPKKELWSGEVWVNMEPFIAMKTADNKWIPWLASQTDILADDWMMVT